MRLHLETMALVAEIRDQTLKETQEISNALIAAEQRIGELLLAIPKAQGFASTIQDNGVQNVKTKTEAVKEMGYSEREAKDYQQMAKNPEIVQKVIDEAIANGEAWQEFIDSIKTSGVIEPIVVTQNKVIVSGHQRVRACKLLEIEEIDAEVKIFDSEDEITKCLIETNIRQRGIGNTNPVKFGRCIKELERIYGIKNGGDRGNQYKEAEPQIAELPTQSDLASQFGMSVDTLNRYKQLADSIPEIQSLVETGIVTPSVARAIMKKLPEFKQKELADKFASEGIKVPLKKAEEEIERLKANEIDLKEERDYLQSQEIMPMMAA